ncbi:DNA-binding response regulator, partial [Xanthomonas campestris]
MSGKRILIVEDDADSANILEAYLLRDGYEVALAED